MEIDGTVYDIAGKKFSKLDEAVQEKLMNAELQMFEMANCTEEEVREMFLRLNSGKPVKQSTEAGRNYGLQCQRESAENYAASLSGLKPGYSGGY